MEWRRVVAFFMGAGAQCSMLRVTLAALAPALQVQFCLTLPQLGVLQAAVLLGYIAGQVPLGMAADQVGGLRVMRASLALWSALGAATPPLVLGAPAGAAFGALLSARAGLGAAQSCLMPSTSAMVSRWVPQDHQARALARVYASCSAGTVVGLVATPAATAALGWPAALQLFSLVGLAWAGLGWLQLPHESSGAQRQESRSALRSPGARAAPGFLRTGRQRGQLALLCWTHSVIGWGFFLLQFWIPSYLHTLPGVPPSALGPLSAVPWAAAAVVGLQGGQLSDWLLTARGWPLLRVRRVFQSIACLGPAAALGVLALAPDGSPPGVSVACLTACLALQALSYSGFHAYIQDVAPGDAGALLGVTNSCSTLAGIAASLCAGVLASTALGYRAVFGLTALLYLLCFVTWNLFIQTPHR